MAVTATVLGVALFSSPSRAASATVLDSVGKFTAPVSPDGFRETAKARLLRGTCYTAPSLAGGRLYLRSDQEMVCVEMKAEAN